MRYPQFEAVSKPRNVQMNFGGINEKESCGESEFLEQKGISAYEYPLLVGDNKFWLNMHREFPYVLGEGITTKEDKLITWGINTSNEVFVNIGGSIHKVSGFFAGVGRNYHDWRLIEVSMGNSILAQNGNTFAYINIDDYTSGLFSESVTALEGQAINIFPCKPGGGTITVHNEAYYKTYDPIDGDYKVADGGGLYQWNSSYGTWVAVANTDVRIQSNGALGTNSLKAGDGVRIYLETDYSSWPEGKEIFPNEEGNFRYIDTVISLVNEDEIQFNAQITKMWVASASGTTLKIERRVPEMTYVTECNNRLWGCAANGHEVYCSKLGDFTNWNCFEGISTDSWASTVGSDGQFNGAATFNNNVFFFKNDSILKVLPSSSGAHVVVENKNRGAIFNESVEVINSVMYYVGIDGVYAFEGSVPVCISDKIKYLENPLKYQKDGNPISCTVKDTYFLAVGYRLYAYDTKKGIWTMHKEFHDYNQHKELMLQSLLLSNLVALHGQLIAVATGVSYTNWGDAVTLFDNALIKITDEDISGTGITTGWEERDFGWKALTGYIGYHTPDHKYVGRVQLYCKPLEKASEMAISVVYEDSGEKVRVGTIRPLVHGQRSFNFTVTPKRCNHFQMLLEGKGKMLVYSMSKSLEEGSDSV